MMDSTSDVVLTLTIGGVALATIIALIVKWRTKK